MRKGNRHDAIHAQESTYFTGKSCVNGHIDQRDTLAGACLTCRREINARAQQKARDIFYGRKEGTQK